MDTRCPAPFHLASIATAAISLVGSHLVYLTIQFIARAAPRRGRLSPYLASSSPSTSGVATGARVVTRHYRIGRSELSNDGFLPRDRVNPVIWASEWRVKSRGNDRIAIIERRKERLIRGDRESSASSSWPILRQLHEHRTGLTSHRR